MTGHFGHLTRQLWFTYIMADEKDPFHDKMYVVTVLGIDDRHRNKICGTCIKTIEKSDGFVHIGYLKCACVCL